MLTEDRARTLLHLAADTIDVEASAPLSTPARRRPLRQDLVAAATVAVLLAGTAALVAAQHSGTSVAASSTTVSDPFTTAWPAPSDPNQLELAPNQMPSLFGYSTDDAIALLQSHGFQIDVRHKDTCDPTPDRVVGTEPSLGSVLAAGDVVTLIVTSGHLPPTVSCVAGSTDYGLAWQLLDWINGRGPGPTFADEVTGTGPEGGRYFQGAGAAAHLGDWHGDFDQLRDAMRHVFYPSRPDLYSTPVLRVISGVDDGGSAHQVTISLDAPDVEPTFPSLASVVLTLDAMGAITAVDIKGDPLAAPTQPYTPHVEGDPLAFAKQRLEAYGYTVSVGPSSCSVLMVASEEVDPDQRTAHLTLVGCAHG